MCRCRSVTGRRAFPRDAFPGRSGHTVLPGISSGGGSILSSGLPFFFFSGACRRGRHRVGSGLPVPGQRKSGSTLAVPRTLYCSRNIPRKPAKAPELPAAPSAPLAHRVAVLLGAMDTGSRPADNSPCRYIQFRGTESPAYNMRTGLRPLCARRIIRSGRLFLSC